MRNYTKMGEITVLALTYFWPKSFCQHLAIEWLNFSYIPIPAPPKISGKLIFAHPGKEMMMKEEGK